MLLRACLTDGNLAFLSEEAVKKMLEFICFEEKIKRLLLECKVLSIMKPLIPDHMMRGEEHYLKSLGFSSKGKGK